jgi:hypothetical protein
VISLEYSTHRFLEKANTALKTFKLRFEQADYVPTNGDFQEFFKSIDLGPDWRRDSFDDMASYHYYRAMDATLSYVLYQIWNRPTSGIASIPEEIVNGAIDDKPLIVQCVDNMLEESLRALLGHGVVPDKNYTPATAMKMFEASVASNMPWFEFKQAKVGELLDLYILCENPDQMYVTAIVSNGSGSGPGELQCSVDYLQRHNLQQHKGLHFRSWMASRKSASLTWVHVPCTNVSNSVNTEQKS